MSRIGSLRGSGNEKFVKKKSSWLYEPFDEVEVFKAPLQTGPYVLSCHATGTSDFCDSPSLTVVSLLVRNITKDRKPDFSESETYVQLNFPEARLNRIGKGTGLKLSLR
jgi:hypothetical protein